MGTIVIRSIAIECSKIDPTTTIDPQKNLKMKFAAILALLAFTSVVSEAIVTLPTCYPLDQPSQPEGPKIEIDCKKCQVEAKIQAALTGKAHHVPSCIVKTNTFSAKQCFGGFCWCVTANGVEIANTKTKKKGLECPRKVKEGHNCAKHAVTKSFKASCAGKDYKKVQCLTNGHCWCSAKDGSLVPNTIYKKNPKKAGPNCGAHAGLKFSCGKLSGNVKHPFDKTRYIKCGAGGKTYGCSCPANTVFDVKERICVAP